MTIVGEIEADEKWNLEQGFLFNLSQLWAVGDVEGGMETLCNVSKAYSTLPGMYIIRDPKE